MSVVAPAPAEVGSQGYINETPQTAHTTAAFNTTGASTLVAFVGPADTPAWNKVPVSISRVSDNLGNSLAGADRPHVVERRVRYGYAVRAIYYVNVPVTSAAHTVTVHLTNPAPLVVEVFAVSGSDITGPPLYSAITDPGTGQTSASVVTAPITVPADTLLPEAGRRARPGPTRRPSTAIPWMPVQPVTCGRRRRRRRARGSYTGDFQYDASIGWQMAVVDSKPAPVRIRTGGFQPGGDCRLWYAGEYHADGGVAGRLSAEL